MKPTNIFLYLLAILLCIVPLSAEQEELQNQNLKIGFVLPLTGDWAFLGEGIRDGATLAQQALSQKGFSVELIFMDNRGDLTSSLSIGKSLIEDKNVDAIISIISGVGILLKPLAAKAGIINIGICSETEVADGHNSFINYLTAEQGVTKFLEHFGKNKSLGIFYLNESGFQRIVNELHRQALPDLKILFEDNFDKGTVDFRALLLKRKKSQVDAWLVLGISPEIEVLVKQARTFGINTPVTSIEGFGLANDKTPFEGAWFVDSAMPNATFREYFKNTFGREVTPGVGHAYDSVMMLAHSFEAAAGYRSKALSIFQQIKDFHGVTSKLSVRESGVIWSEASVKVIRNGKAVLLQE